MVTSIIYGIPVLILVIASIIYLVRHRRPSSTTVPSRTVDNRERPGQPEPGGYNGPNDEANRRTSTR